jgi:hypothetical protein
MLKFAPLKNQQFLPYMMKVIHRAAFMLLFVFMGYSGFGQRDLIITQAGEEIRCKILDETPTRFVYAYIGPKSKVIRNEIFKNLVTSFKFNHYSSDLLVNPKIKSGNYNSQQKKTDLVKAEPATKEEKKESKKKPVAQQPIKTESPAVVEKTVEKPLPLIETPLVVKQNDVAKLDSTALAKIDTLKIETSSSMQTVELAQEKATTKADTIKSAILLIDVANVETKRTEDSTQSMLAKATEPTTIAALPEPAKGDNLAQNTNSSRTETVKPETQKDMVAPLAEPDRKTEFQNFMKYRVGFKGGLGNIAEKNANTSPYGLYKEKLMRGWIFGFDAAYFATDHVGLGLTYNSFQANNASNKIDYPDFFTAEAIVGGSLSNKITHQFVGPTLLFRKAIDFKTFAVLTLSPGMHFYTDKGQTNERAFKFQGKSFGAAATLGLDFLIGNDIFGRDIILSLEGGYNYGELKTLDYNGNLGIRTLLSPINLNRLDFSIGLRFTRFPMYLR